MKLEILQDYGIDWKKGIARCLNDKDLYEAMLGLFLEDDTFPRAVAAFENEDNLQLFRCLHELKGACGNADMVVLYDAVCPLVELLRKGAPQRETLEPLMERITQAYQRTREGILKARDMEK